MDDALYSRSNYQYIHYRLFSLFCLPSHPQGSNREDSEETPLGIQELVDVLIVWYVVDVPSNLRDRETKSRRISSSCDVAHTDMNHRCEPDNGEGEGHPSCFQKVEKKTTPSRLLPELGRSPPILGVKKGLHVEYSQLMQSVE